MFESILVIIFSTMAVSFWVGHKKGYSGILLALITFPFPLMAVIVFFLPDRNEMKKNAEISRIREGARSLELRAKQEAEHMPTMELIYIGLKHLLEGNYSMVLPSLLMAAERGDAQAQHICALLYKTGVGCTADAEKALYWAEKAAQQGDEDAQELCLSILLEGLTDASPEKVRHWIETVSAQGDECTTDLLEAINLLEKLQNNTTDTK